MPVLMRLQRLLEPVPLRDGLLFHRITIQLASTLAKRLPD